MGKKALKLSIKNIENFTFEGSSLNAHDIRWDTKITGFGVRIYPSGRKSFVLSYRLRGRKSLMVLGSCNKMTLEQARKKAQRELSKVLDGIDPSKKKREKDDTLTFAELGDMFIERYAKIHRKHWQEDERRIRNRLKPAIGRKRVDEVTSNDLDKIYEQIAVQEGKTYEGNRVIELTRRIFELAREKWNKLPEGHTNPAKKVERLPEKSRERYVKQSELPKLIKAIENEPNIHVRGVFWLYLLTGLRKNELLRAKWEHIDWDRKELVVEENKSDRTHYAPLSSEAISILQTLPKLDDNPYIFPGRKSGKPLVNIAKAWRRVRKQAEMEDVRLHDLRRTLGSWLAQDGKSLPLIGKILNHSDTKATQIYARFARENVCEAVESHGASIRQIAGKAFQ
jgi:integrase